MMTVRTIKRAMSDADIASALRDTRCEGRAWLCRSPLSRLGPKGVDVRNVLEAISHKWPDLCLGDFWGGYVLAAALAQETEGSA